MEQAGNMRTSKAERFCRRIHNGSFIPPNPGSLQRQIKRFYVTFECDFSAKTQSKRTKIMRVIYNYYYVYVTIIATECQRKSTDSAASSLKRTCFYLFAQEKNGRIAIAKMRGGKDGSQTKESV